MLEDLHGVSDAAKKLRLPGKQVKLFQKTFELTKQTRDLVEEEYKAGNAELTRLNEAQKDLVNAEMNLVSSVVKMNQAKAQLEAAVNLR